MPHKAVVMAGGNATRLYPASRVVNKHMLPVYDRPMIQHVVELLVSSGITDIHILLNNDYAFPIQQHLEGGAAFDCSITYSYERKAISPVLHLLMAQKFVGDNSFTLICGDSFYRAPLALDGITSPHMWVMPLGDFDDFSKYAEVGLDDDSRVVSFTEHPTEQKTGVIQTGAWLLPPDAFGRAARLMNEATSEVQIRHLVREYIDEGTMHATMIPPESFLDLGTPEALYQASTLVRASLLA